jgi:hypothetical protein
LNWRRNAEQGNLSEPSRGWLVLSQWCPRYHRKLVRAKWKQEYEVPTGLFQRYALFQHGGLDIAALRDKLVKVEGGKIWVKIKRGLHKNKHGWMDQRMTHNLANLFRKCLLPQISEQKEHVQSITFFHN